MLVGIDHPRRDDAVADVDQRRAGIPGGQLSGRSHADDDVVVDGNGATEQHVAPLVHGDDIAAGEQQHQVRPRTKGCASACGGRTLVAKTDMTTMVATNGSDARRSGLSS